MIIWAFPASQVGLFVVPAFACIAAQRLTPPLLSLTRLLAKKYSKNAGQVILRFENQEGIIVFPKSTHKERIKSNMEIFDFELTEDEMNEIRALDKGHGRHNPDAPGIGEMLLKAYDVHKNE